MSAIFITVATFCFCMTFFTIIQVVSERKRKKEQVGHRFQTKQQVLGWSDSLIQRFEKMDWSVQLAPRLSRASIRLNPVEYVLILIVVGILLQFLITMLFELNWYFAAPMICLLVPFASKQFLLIRERAYIRRLEAALPEMCRLLSSAISAGLSITQALLLIAQEIEEPLSLELAPICRDIQLGESLEQVLTDWTKRLPSRDFHLFVHSILIQKEAGGDLGKVMNDMGITLEERKVIQKSIDAVIAQSRSTAYILPVLSVGFVFLFHRLFGGLNLLFQSWLGFGLMVIFVFLQVIGFLLVRRISNIQV